MPFKIDELFYELDARTAGFENKITHAQSTVDNFAKFIREKPMLATAALGASLVAVGIAAVKMASDVDDSLRKVQAAFPGATAQIDKLRNAVALLSTESPRSQRELAEAAARITEKGVGSVDELIARLRTVTLIADATGESMDTIADGLDNIADAFRLTTKQASEALTVIYGYTQGKVAISEVFAALQKGGAVLADLGVKAEDAGQAMAAMIDAGVNRRQVGVVLTTVLELTNRVRELRRGTEDQARAGDIIENTLSRQNIASKGFVSVLGELADRLQKAGIDTRELGIRSNTLTAITRVAAAAAADHRTQAEKLADAQERLAKAADTNRTSAHALSQILINELSESFIRLGNKILPTVISLLEKTANLMARIRGEGNPLKDIQTLQGPLPAAGANPNATLRQTAFESPADKAARAFEDALKGAGTRAERYGADAFSGLTEAELRKMIDNVQKYSRFASSGTSPKQIDTLFRALQDALAKTIAEAASEKPGGGTNGPPPDTAPLEKATRDAIRAMRESVRATFANATTTQIDDAQAMVEKFRAEVDALEKQARQKLPDLRAEVDRLSGEPARIEAKERAEAARSAADEVAKALGLQSVAMSQALDDFNAEVARRNEEYRKLGKAPLFTDDQIAEVRAVREALIQSTQSAEDLDAALSRIRAQETGRKQLTPSSTREQRLDEMGFNVASSIELQAELAKRQNELAQVAGKTDAASKAKAKALLDQIATLQAKINGLETTNRQISNDINNALLKRIQLLEEQASAIGSAVSLVAQLAGAFGETGQKIAGVVSGIGQIGQAAASVGPFLESLKVFKSGAKDDAGNPLMSLGSLLGKAQPIVAGITAAVGLIGQLFGGDPRIEQARAENNAAMQRLTAALVDLRDAYIQNASSADVQRDIANALKLISQTGRDNLGRVTFAGQVVGPDKEGGGPGSRGTLRAIGRSLGYDYDSGELLKYFQDFDRRYGTNFAQFIERQAPQGLLAAIEKAPDAIKEALGNLGKYANDAAGVIDRVNFQFGILGKTNAVEKFKAIIDALKSAGIDMGDFADDFATLANASATAEERQAAIDDALQKILAGANYGALTPEQVKQILQEGADALRGSGALGTGGFNVDRTITEVTGSRLQALLVTGNTYLEQIANATTAMASVMGIGGLPGISPPQFATMGPGGGVTYNITIEFNGPVVGDPEAIGGRIGTGIVKRIDQGLGREAKLRAITNGVTLKR